jgi:hypothetical protein
VSKLTNKLRWAWFDFGVREERKRILQAIQDAPVAMDFFGPYIAKDKLIALINGEDTPTDAEATEIPQFEGTRDALNALSIKGENE